MSVRASCEGEKNGIQFCISVAGHVAAIEALHSEVYTLCKDYLSELSPDIHICTSEKDLAIEREEAFKNHLSCEDSYLETLVVYRKLCDEMLAFDTFLMHGAVLGIGSKSFMFTAASGTGKTTHIKKWLNNDENVYVINGDKPLIRIDDTQVIACGTPWCGKEHLGKNTMVPLEAIVLMERGSNNTIEEISYSQAFSFLLKQIYWPDNTNLVKKTLALQSQLNGKVRFYKFVFNNYKEDAFETSYRALVGNESFEKIALKRESRYGEILKAIAVSNHSYEEIMSFLLERS